MSAPTSSGRTRVPDLHLLMNDEILARESVLASATELLERGGPRVAFHLRGPGSTGRHLWTLGSALLDRARSSGSRLIVNDRVDVALALGPRCGIHLGARSLPPRIVRDLVGPDVLVGRSVHGPEEVEELDGGSHLDALDYLMVGTLFRTPSHPGREGSGPEGLERVSKRTSLPLVGVGGVTPDRVRALGERHATGGALIRGVAVIRWVWDAPDPPRALERYLDALDSLDAPNGSGESQ